MTDVWQPGTTYAPGSTVIPIAAPVTYTTHPANPRFEDGANGWNARPGWYHQPTGGYNGGGCMKLAQKAGVDVQIVNTNQVPVTTGQSITATCYVAQGASSAHDAEGRVALFWFDSARVVMANSPGSLVYSSDNGRWQPSTVTASAPAGAAFCAVGFIGKNVGKYPMAISAFSWNYSAGSGAAPMVYTATQAQPGKSGATEPSWTTTPGSSVTDNEVTWNAGNMTSVTWTAGRILESGPDQPNWPTTPGQTVKDGSITWVCVTPQVQDPNCPQSKFVVVASSKVYAADKDIIRYSSTADPLDWTAQGDAGFLPFGLQSYGSNPIEAMGLYRSNLVAFNSEGFQMWQVDEDPNNSALIDALPIGSTQHKAMSPVSNDLFFLASQGVRTMGIAAGSVNLQAGDVGMPIDPLVQESVAAAVAAGISPLATYYPSQGQYWLAIPDWPATLFF